VTTRLEEATLEGLRGDARQGEGVKVSDSLGAEAGVHCDSLIWWAVVSCPDD